VVIRERAGRMADAIDTAETECAAGSWLWHAMELQEVDDIPWSGAGRCLDGMVTSEAGQAPSHRILRPRTFFINRQGQGGKQSPIHESRDGAISH
jgi:hypothetical protein